MVDADDTIVAIATASGPAALALIRVSGRRAFSVCDLVFRGRRPLASRRGWTLAHGHVVSAAGTPVDEVLAAVFRAPKSYTGEDMVELIGHGGPGAARAVLSALIGAGARLAEPGEFTRRAYVSGRLDLAQAESVVDLIQAATSRARIRHGSPGRRLEPADPGSHRANASGASGRRGIPGFSGATAGGL